MRGAQAVGAEVTLIDLKDYPLPIMDEDVEKESGAPANAVALKKLFIAHDGLMIAAPEYNSSITPLLKNTIDWVSRPAPGEPPLVAYSGKGAILMSASPGGLGGLRGLVTVRSILGNIGVIVLPDQVAVGRAFEAFNADGTLKDAKVQSGVENLGATLAGFLAKVHA